MQVAVAVAVRQVHTVTAHPVVATATFTRMVAGAVVGLTEVSPAMPLRAALEVMEATIDSHSVAVMQPRRLATRVVAARVAVAMKSVTWAVMASNCGHRP